MCTDTYLSVEVALLQEKTLDYGWEVIHQVIAEVVKFRQ